MSYSRGEAMSDSDSDTASEQTLRASPLSAVSNEESPPQQNSTSNFPSSRSYINGRRGSGGNNVDSVFVPTEVKKKNSKAKEAAGSVRHLKDLLTRLSGMISMSGTSDNTAEMLMFLSDTDPNFHTLQLVKAMRVGARAELGVTVEDLVHDYLENSDNKIKQENPVVAVLNNLFQQDMFLQYMEKFQGSLLSSSDYLHQNFDEEMATVMHDFYLNSNMNREKAYDSSSNASSLNSSLNQSGFLFLTAKQYNSIATILINKQQMSKWSEVLTQLLSVTPGEPVIQQSWFDIKKGLKNCLILPLQFGHSEQNDIFEKALKMHSKLLASQTQMAVTEAFLNLIEAVSEFWFSKKLSSFLADKFTMDLVQSSPIFLIIKLILDFLRDLSLIWIRYPEHLTISLIESWFDFLSIRGVKEESLSSCDVVCILDPEAKWVQHWLHPRYTRTKALSVIGRSPLLLKNALRHSLEFLVGKKRPSNEIISEKQSNRLSASELELIKITYNVSFVLEIIKYEEGRQLFPVSLTEDDEPISVSSFLTAVFKYGGQRSNSKLSYVVRENLRDVASTNEQVVRLLCKAGIHLQYTQELLKRHYMERESVTTLLSTLKAILNTEKGLRFILLGSSDNGSLYLVSNDFCNDLLSLFGRLLVEEHQMSLNYSLAFEMTTTLINSEVGRYLYSGHQTFRQTLTNLTSLYHKRYSMY